MVSHHFDACPLVEIKSTGHILISDCLSKYYPQQDMSIKQSPPPPEETEQEQANCCSGSESQVVLTKQQQRKALKKEKKAERRAQRENPNAGQKPCDMCGKPVNLLIRCMYEEGQVEWRMVCGRCWNKASGGVVDGDADHPHYRYGGLWKNRN